MSPHPSLSLFAHPFSPLSPPDSERNSFSLDDIKGVEASLATTFPPSPPASFPSTSPSPALDTHKSSVSSVEDLDLGPIAPFPADLDESSQNDASALSGQYLARYLHYRQLALASAQTDQEVDNILAAYSINSTTSGAAPLTSMDQIYQQQYPAMANAVQQRQVFMPQHQEAFYDFAQAQNVMYASGLPPQLSSMGSGSPVQATQPISPKTSSQRATLMQAIPMQLMPGQQSYAQYYPAPAPRAISYVPAGVAWNHQPYASSVPADLASQFSFPAAADAHANAASQHLRLRLPRTEEMVTPSVPASTIGDAEDAESSDSEEPRDSSRDSSSLDLHSVSSVPNMHGGGRGYVPGATPDDPKKRHKCDVCGRGFARAFNLKVRPLTRSRTDS